MDKETLILPVVIVLLAIAMWNIWLVVERNALEEIRQEMAEIGLVNSIDELIPEAIQDHQNAANAYQEAFDLFSSYEFTEPFMAILQTDPEELQQSDYKEHLNDQRVTEVLQGFRP